MHQHFTSEVLRDGEEKGRHVSEGLQHAISSDKAFDISAVYHPVEPQTSWTPAHSHLEQTWAIPTSMQSGQSIDAYGNELLPPNGDMDLLIQQWLHRQAATTLPLSSSVDIPAYTEPATSSTLSPLSDNDLGYSTPPALHNQVHQTSTGSPLSSHNIDNTITSNESIPPLTSAATYFDMMPSTTALAMSYQPPTTTFDEYQNLLQSTTTSSAYDNMYPTMGMSTAYQPVQEPYSDMQSLVSDLSGHAFEASAVSEPPYPATYHASEPEDLSESHTHEYNHNHDQESGVQPEFSLEDLRTIRRTTNQPKKRNTQRKKEANILTKTPRAEPVSRQTSCWRCRRYKKPCNGKGSVCDACVTSGFRIWSSDIGCRKGDMNDFMLMLIPSKVEATPITINVSYLKPPSFRQSAQIYPSETIVPISAAKGDAWDQFLYKVQSTGIHGPGVLELLQVAIRYQRKFKKPDKVIVSAVRAMSVAADIFRLLVATKDSDMFTSTIDLSKIFAEARKVLAAAAGHFLRNCLTGRIKQWFSTFIASNINVFAYILVGDAIAAIPTQYRAEVWPDVRKTLMDLRQVLYPTARDLLNALSKGSQPLNMSCWEMVQEDVGPGKPPKLVRNAEGMRLVDYCEATFDAMKELQQWRERFSYLLYGDSWMTNQPLAVDLLLISSVARMYITPKS